MSDHECRLFKIVFNLTLLVLQRKGMLDKYIRTYSSRSRQAMFFVRKYVNDNSKFQMKILPTS